jgi:hypothetical protein
VRYLKGSVCLNETQDKRLLEWVVDARFITHSQLFALTRLELLGSSRAVFNWRVRRMVQGGLLRKQVVAFLASDALYSATRAGLHALEEMGVPYAAGFTDRETDPHEAQIPHILELTRIRLALLRSGTLMRWISESFIRVLSLSPIHAYAKTYDAIATVSLGGGRCGEFAIEYERTLKSPQKYDKVRQAIESEERLTNFLYLSPSFPVLSAIGRHFERTRQNVYFGAIQNFKEHALDAEVFPGRGYPTRALRTVLELSATNRATAL